MREKIGNDMKTLTAKEEEVMELFWKKGPLFVKQLLEFYEEPRPHFNTLSTVVRGLEEKGFLGHNAYGNSYQYYPVVTKEDFKRKTLKGVISKYFNNSYMGQFLHGGGIVAGKGRGDFDRRTEGANPESGGRELSAPQRTQRLTESF